jgi:hypothetical protein
MNAKEDGIVYEDENDIVTIGILKDITNLIGRDLYKTLYILYGFIGFQVAFDTFIVLKYLGVF